MFSDTAVLSVKRLLICLGAATALFGQTTSGTAPASDHLLPSWLKLNGEIRGRGEAFTGIGYVHGAEDAYYLHRIRLGTTVSPTTWLRGFVQLQDSRVAGWDRGKPPGGVQNTFDIRQAWVEAGAGEGNGWGLRVGRQPFIFGDMRLISTSNWGNVGPNYDGARLTYKSAAMKLDMFATEVVQPVTSEWDHWRSSKRLHGAHGTFGKLIPKATLETYFFWKQNSVAGPDLRIYTLGGHLFGKLPRHFDYNIEMAHQHGRDGVRTMGAWAGHWEAGRSIKEERVRFSAEYNYGSGDSNPNDGRRGDFDNLYPTDKYGTCDNIAWRNIHETIVNVEWKPTRKLKTKLAWHDFWVASRKDALYAIAGAVLARNPNATSSHVGNELDVRVIWQATPHFQLFCGYAYMFSGEYLKQATKGSNIHYPYVMWTYSF